MYRAIFSRRAEKAFMSLYDREARRVKEAIQKLIDNPRARGTMKLEGAPVARYRYRIGDYRILFDIDDVAKVMEILDIRKRDERTYR
jgi:mRNA interferase RelE/StbE